MRVPSCDRSCHGSGHDGTSEFRDHRARARHTWASRMIVAPSPRREEKLGVTAISQQGDVQTVWQRLLRNSNEADRCRFSLTQPKSGAKRPRVRRCRFSSTSKSPRLPRSGRPPYGFVGCDLTWLFGQRNRHELSSTTCSREAGKCRWRSPWQQMRFRQERCLTR